MNEVSRHEQSLGDEPQGFAKIGSEASASASAQTMQPRQRSLGDIQPRDTNDTAMPRMFDATMSSRLFIEVISTLDEAADVQVIGATTDAPENANVQYAIGQAITLAAKDRAGAHVDMDKTGMPFIGVRITPLSAPTEGSVMVHAYSQHHMDVK